MSCINDLAKCDAAYFALKQQLNDAEYKLAAAQAREKVLRDALEKLACLGNGDRHGNSIGNEIAIDALSVLIGDKRQVWCEVVDADLHMLEETVPMRCEPCRETGAIHCADPQNCGGPWTTPNAEIKGQAGV